MIALVSDIAAGSAHAPVIGISGSNADSASVRAMMTQIRSAGAVPMFLGNHAIRDAAADISKIDGLIVMGNNDDIDPAKYGAQKDPHTTIEKDTARAEYEEKILIKALAAKMPVLGVCGGMQRLNVLAGGTLHQHIPDILGHNRHAQQDYGIAPFVPVQVVSIAPDSTLGKIAGDIGSIYTPSRQKLGRGVVMENSMHHQAVAKLGEGLRVCAVSNEADGKHVIEGFENDPNFGPLKGQCVMGVQWHPEFSASPLGAKIAEHFVARTKEFALAQNRTHPPEETLLENTKSASPQTKNLEGFAAKEAQRRANSAQLTR